MFTNECFKRTYSTKVHGSAKKLPAALVESTKKPRRMAGLFSIFVLVQEGIQTVSPRSGQGQNQKGNEIQ